MTNLTHDQFLVELGKLFQASRLGGPGSVSVTLKHYNGQTKPTPRSPVAGGPPLKKPVEKHDKHHEHENSCLFRAKLGRKTIRTVVHAKDVNKFHLAYANVLKANMDNLEKRSKKPEEEKATGGGGVQKSGKVTKKATAKKPKTPGSPQKKSAEASSTA